jgi:hypothetical protein
MLYGSTPALGSTGGGQGRSGKQAGLLVLVELPSVLMLLQLNDAALSTKVRANKLRTLMMYS